MSIWVGVLTLVAVIGFAATLGIAAAWVAADCYPWRRCGKCGWNEWRIFRRRQ